MLSLFLFVINDFGGQVHYRRQYLDSNDYWRNISAIIFIIDVQDQNSFEIE